MDNSDIIKTYTRKAPRKTNVKNKSLRTNLKKIDAKYKNAIQSAANTEVLKTEEYGFLEAEGLEKTYNFTQDSIKKYVDVSTAQKGFNLKLDTFGPYYIDYTRNGRYLLIGGSKGHIASFDWREGNLQSEIQVKETVRDVKWLHNEQYYAVAQKKYVYIYDRQGIELHQLKQHVDVNVMEFLPYHFLLATVGNSGWLKYQDVSTGSLVSEIRTKQGSVHTMTQNPQNAIIHLGHNNGTVTLWSPTCTTPLVKLLVHKGPVKALAVDRDGRYMASAGADGRMNIWDIRNYKEVHSYFTPTPATTLDISHTGLLAVGWGPHVTVWKDAFKTKQKSPYMSHLSPASPINDLQFCPYEDILGAGHQNGFSSLIIPGAGEANYDAFEANPYQSSKQRREAEVHSLLEKLQPDMISLDSNFIGKLDPRANRIRSKVLSAELELKEKEAKNNKLKEKEKLKVKDRAKGKNSALRRFLRKKTSNVIDQRRLHVESLLKTEKQLRDERIRKEKGEVIEDNSLPPALARFQTKS